jgi:cystathionine beta-lyase/cystathionine gamma-synthase
MGAASESLPDKKRRPHCQTDELIRISVGLEDIEDLLEDLEQTPE